MDFKHRMVRTYTAYGELGDLHTLWQNHKRMRDHTRDENGNPLNLRITRIPTVVVIYLCEAMAASVCLMANGQLPNDQGVWNNPGTGQGDEPDPPWPHDVVLRDIKLANYFLSECRNPTRWNGLPTAALGDFGNGIDLRDPFWGNNPQICMGMGTTDCQAPEQVVTLQVPLRPMSSATNVFQVGLAMQQLMTLTAPFHQMTFDQSARPFPPVDGRFYPKDLRDLADRCIQVEPAQRPSPKAFYMRMRALALSLPESTFISYNNLVPWGKFDL